VVIGEVTTPGMYRAAAGSRLLDLIAGVGGLTATADLTNILVMDQSGATRTANYTEALAHPESEANLSVSNAALVVVSRGRNQVTVLGEVASPTNITALSPVRLSALLAQVGGLSRAAESHRVQIIRAKGTSEIVDVARLMGQAAPGSESTPGEISDPLLYAGDSVIVPRRYARVVVLGRVASPGSYEFEEGDTVVNAIAKAGGLSRKALKKEISIIRREGDTAKVISLDVKAALRGTEWISEPLQDRDIVYVPAGGTPVWGQIATGLLGVGTFIRLFVQ
jgi:polysaccharide export outer membrane protein